MDGSSGCGARLREGVNDLVDWWPKIRPGGVMAGHDYGRREDSGDGITVHGVFGVTEAVRRFFAAVNVQNFFTATFFFIKPRYALTTYSIA